MTNELIGTELGQIIKEEGVIILYACESGSRAWGFASPDSDYDVRFLYARPVTEYLRLTPPRDVIEIPIHDDLDIHGWDILKCCRLLRKSNPHLIEWLGSPIVYLENGPFAEELRLAARKWFSKRACCEHYLSMALQNYTSYVEGREQVIRKKYLYVLRPLACICWILENDSFPPTPFVEVLNGIPMPTAVRKEIDILLIDKKKNQEMGAGSAVSSLTGYIMENLERLPIAVHSIPGSRFPEKGLNELIFSTLS